ncbi:MAG TPA: undecaprenyldiphospho-muramoylpentapeptide beta-N-acetylglucosaminyltransferase [Microbacteriaceae bacterium]
MKFLLAGGGTAGHVNPLLATADLLADLGHEIEVVGTKEGLESRLVPERGYALSFIPKLPFPRKLGFSLLSFPFKFLSIALSLRKRIKRVDVVIGFGGYVSAPVYLAAKIFGTPLVIHEANALPGIANRFGAKLTKHVATSFPSQLQGKLIGVPLREEIAAAANYDIQQARVELGLDPSKPVLLVTGGSQGAQKINKVVIEALEKLKAAGVQVYHIAGQTNQYPEKISDGYVRVGYCNRMELAIRACDFAISRAGAATVSEFMAMGVPAVFIPYPVGNGEQRFNVLQLIDADASLIVDDKDFDVEYVNSELIPILSSKKRLLEMSQKMKSFGRLDATEKLVEMALEAKK